MFHDLTVSYVNDGIETTLTIDDDYCDNLPYNLAAIFSRVVKETNANPKIVIEEMESYLDVGEMNVNE